MRRSALLLALLAALVAGLVSGGPTAEPALADRATQVQLCKAAYQRAGRAYTGVCTLESLYWLCSLLDTSCKDRFRQQFLVEARRPPGEPYPGRARPAGRQPASGDTSTPSSRPSDRAGGQSTPAAAGPGSAAPGGGSASAGGGSASGGAAASPGGAASDISGAASTDASGEDAPASPDGRGGAAAQEDKSLYEGDPAQCKAGNGQTRANCAATGVPHRAYPLNHYNFDIHIQGGLTRPGESIALALSGMLQWPWMIMLNVLEGLLGLLRRALELNLFSDGENKLDSALQAGQDYLTTPWLGTALVAMGLWMGYVGIVRRRATQAIGGMLASLALMSAAFLIIARPHDTVVLASRLADQASSAVFGGLYAGKPGDGRAQMNNAQAELFDHLARPGFCLLDFGSTAMCERKPPAKTPEATLKAPGAPRAAQTIGDLYLQWPEGGRERLEITDAFEHLVPPAKWVPGQGMVQEKTPPPEQRAIEMQKSGSIAVRAGLLVMILVGFGGAILLFASLTVRLLAFAIMALVLVMFAPVMLLAAALGDAGRQAFAGWAKQLLGALFGKVVYAVFLAVAMLASEVMWSVDWGSGWLPGWLLVSALWWTLFLKRAMFTEWLALGHAEQRGGVVAAALGGMYFGTRMVGQGMRGIAAATRAPRRTVARAHLARKEGAQAALTSHTNVEADRALGARLANDRRTVQGGLQDGEALRVKRAALARHEAAVASGGSDRLGPGQVDALQQEISGLQARLSRPELGAARRNVEQAELNKRRRGEEFTQDERDAWKQRRERELAQAAHRTPRTADGRVSRAARKAWKVVRRDKSPEPGQPVESFVKPAAPFRTGPFGEEGYSEWERQHGMGDAHAGRSAATAAPGGPAEAWQHAGTAGPTASQPGAESGGRSGAAAGGGSASDAGGAEPPGAGQRQLPEPAPVHADLDRLADAGISAEEYAADPVAARKTATERLARQEEVLSLTSFRPDAARRPSYKKTYRVLGGKTVRLESAVQAEELRAARRQARARAKVYGRGLR